MKTGLNLDFGCKGTIFFLYTQDFLKKVLFFLCNYLYNREIKYEKIY